jgi:hypothetical protein
MNPEKRNFGGPSIRMENPITALADASLPNFKVSQCDARRSQERRVGRPFSQTEDTDSSLVIVCLSDL